MTYIVLIAVVGILLLQASGAIPQSSVGGPITIALAVFAAVLAVAIHEAWTKKRGVVGWIVNVVVTFVGAIVIAPIGGEIIAILIALVAHVDGSLAKTGGPVMAAGLAGGMVAALMGAWGALWIVNRWR